MRRALIVASLGLLPLSGKLESQTSRPLAQAFSVFSDDADRPRLGISTRASGRRDTLGLLVSDVTRGSPAEKAGIEEGDRLVSVNGVNLRLSREDAEDEMMTDIATRRLTRELAKHKAGDEVELRVYRDGQTRTIRAKLVAPEDLETDFYTTRSVRSALRDRPVLGISFGGTGSRRDTLGMLVVGVNDSGPAALAGIEEGDRIAAINGVDLRVDREDAGDWESSSVRIRRFNRAMEKVKPGDEVELRVYSQGQTRNTRVKAVRAGDLSSRSGSFFFGDGPRIIRDAIVRPAPAPLLRPGAKVLPRIYYSNPRVSVDIEPTLRDQERARELIERAAERATEARVRSEEVLRRSEEAVRRAIESRRSNLRYRSDLDGDDRPKVMLAPRASVTRVAPAMRVTEARVSPLPLKTVAAKPAIVASTFGGSRARAMAAPRPSTGIGGFASLSGPGLIIVAGLRLAAIDRDLATYLGNGSERGLLVVQRSEHWPGIREGDVVMAIDGRSVRRADGSMSVSFREVSRSVVEVLRNGKRIEVRIDR